MKAPEHLRADALRRLSEFRGLLEAWRDSGPTEQVPDHIALKVLEFGFLYDSALDDLRAEIAQVLPERGPSPTAAEVRKCISEKCAAWTADFARKAKRKAFVEGLERRSKGVDLEL